MPVTVDLPAEAIQRLEAEAARRGVSIDVLIADLAASLPAANTTPRRNPAFVAIGASERGATDRFEETLAEGFGRDQPVLLVDTGVLLAAADRTDRHHARCAAIVLDDPGPLVTTPMVIGEAAYLLERALGPDAEAALYASIVTGDLLVEPLGQRDWVRTHQLVETYADLPLGGTDASLVAVAERLGITRVATLDHTRFRAVSPVHCAAFDLLP